MLWKIDRTVSANQETIRGHFFGFYKLHVDLTALTDSTFEVGLLLIEPKWPTCDYVEEHAITQTHILCMAGFSLGETERKLRRNRPELMPCVRTIPASSALLALKRAVRIVTIAYF